MRIIHIADVASASAAVQHRGECAESSHSPTALFHKPTSIFAFDREIEFTVSFLSSAQPSGLNDLSYFSKSEK